MYHDIITEHRVRQKLSQRFGWRVDSVTQVCPDCWMARLADGGLAYATVQADGSVSIVEREVVC